MKVILTGATGMVGEGVLIECLDNEQVTSVLYVGRKPSGKEHPKLSEYIVPEFLLINSDNPKLSGYDACFYCAGISSIGMKESDYTHITYDITLYFATVLQKLNLGMVFNFVSGSHTDSTEKGKVMWARVKGKTENALSKMNFRDEYNFRPGLIKPDKTQIHIKGYYKYIKLIYPILGIFYTACTVREIAKAMIFAVKSGFSIKTLGVKDIKKPAYL